MNFKSLSNSPRDKKTYINYLNFRVCPFIKKTLDMILATRGNHIKPSRLKRHLLMRIRVVQGTIKIIFRDINFDRSRMRNGYQSNPNHRWW